MRGDLRSDGRPRRAHDQRQRPRPRSARAAPQPPDPDLGLQHPPHQPPPVADHRGRPRRRRQGHRHRPDPHADRRGRRRVRPAAPRHRRRPDAGDDARPRARRARRPRRGSTSTPSGFPELADHVSDWTPERAAAICGVAARVIERLAHDWGTIRPAAIRTLIGAEHHENGAMFYRTLAVLPAARRGVAGPRRRPGPQRRVVPGRADRRGGDRAPRPAARAAPACDQHEPPRRGPHRPDDGSAGRCPRRVELQPAGHRAQRRADPGRHGARRPVHRRPRAVPHRHRPLRRHRPAGHHAARDHRRRAGVGPPVDGLERGRHRAASASRAATPSCSAASPRAMGLTDPALQDSDEAILQQALGHKVDLDELRRVGWLKVPYPAGRPGVGGRRVPDAVGQGRAGQRAARGDGPAGAADVRATAGGPARRPGAARPVPAAADDAEAPLPLLELRLRPAAPPRPAGGRSVRRARRRRRRPARASPTAISHASGTTGPA